MTSTSTAHSVNGSRYNRSGSEPTPLPTPRWRPARGTVGALGHTLNRLGSKQGLRWSVCLCAVLQLSTLLMNREAENGTWWTGIVLYIAAASLFGWSVAVQKRSRPACNSVKKPLLILIRSGPYRLIRHPIYTSFLLAWLAGVFVSGQPWLLLSVLWMGLCYHLAARRKEEEYATSDLAEDYKDYLDDTGRFLPDPRCHIARLLFRIASKL
jgi:protein-S-isoprenylcysteine O-methyltransferase Ste14